MIRYYPIMSNKNATTAREFFYGRDHEAQRAKTQVAYLDLMLAQMSDLQAKGLTFDEIKAIQLAQLKGNK